MLYNTIVLGGTLVAIGFAIQVVDHIMRTTKSTQVPECELPTARRHLVLTGDLIGSVLGAPLFEEPICRLAPAVMVLHHRLAAIGVGLALNILFAAMHSAAAGQTRAIRFIRTFGTGTVYLMAALMCHSVYPALVLHSAWNLWQSRDQLTGKPVELPVYFKGSRQIVCVTGWRLIPGSRSG